MGLQVGKIPIYIHIYRYICIYIPFKGALSISSFRNSHFVRVPTRVTGRPGRRSALLLFRRCLAATAQPGAGSHGNYTQRCVCTCKYIWIYIYIYICYPPHEPHVGPFYTVNTNRNRQFLVIVLTVRFESYWGVEVYVYIDEDEYLDTDIGKAIDI